MICSCIIARGDPLGAVRIWVSRFALALALEMMVNRAAGMQRSSTLPLLYSGIG